MSDAVEQKPNGVLDIDAVKGKTKNRVSLVGIELEGAWTKLPAGVQQLEHDGSVFNGRMPAGAKYLGELPIGPMLPAAIPEMIRIHHPQKVNHTCGMHVHMSFETLWHYQILMVPEYQETVLYYLGEWATREKLKESHALWPRLRGESEFCQKKFWPDLQAAAKRKGHDRHEQGHRYTHVHYCGRPGMNTIEIRTLPMMDTLRRAVGSVNEIIQITNACIHVLGAKQKRDVNQMKVSLPGNLTYEETIIEVL